MFVFCVYCLLSSRGLCVGLITRPDESYRVLCVWVWLRGPVKGGCDLESGRSVTGRNIYLFIFGVFKGAFDVSAYGIKWRVTWRIVNEGGLEVSCSFPNNLLLSSKVHICNANPSKHRNYRMNLVSYCSQMLHFAHAASVYVTCESLNKRLLFP
jgi:hypothetical protein